MVQLESRTRPEKRVLGANKDKGIYHWIIKGLRLKQWPRTNLWRAKHHVHCSRVRESLTLQSPPDVVGGMVTLCGKSVPL